ncbi:PadR family transcriptional regulator, partial [bacterium]|nr:PadR family transcriptional regulator [bacterium]
MLSGNDEVLLLAVEALGDHAYGATLMKALTEITGRNWSIGAIYDPLYRMEKKGLVLSEMAAPGLTRGARSRRVYKLTEDG